MLTGTCESDAAAVPVSFDFGEDPEIQSTTVTFK